MSQAEVIRDVVVGKADPSTLSEIGVRIEFEASGVTIETPGGTPVVWASVSEVATGYVAAWASGHDALTKWAQTVLGVLAIDLSALEDSADGEALLEAVSDAAEGRADGVDLATRLAH